MNHTLTFQQLDIYVAARELAAVMHGAGIADAELRDQASRASKSVFLGICEGLPNEQAGLRRKYFPRRTVHTAPLFRRLEPWPEGSQGRLRYGFRKIVVGPGAQKAPTGAAVAPVDGALYLDLPDRALAIGSASPNLG